MARKNSAKPPVGRRAAGQASGSIGSAAGDPGRFTQSAAVYPSPLDGVAIGSDIVRSTALTASDIPRTTSISATVIDPSLIVAGQISAGALRPMSASAPPTLVREMVDLGRLVRRRRKALGLSQQDLADGAGVGRRFVSELENGKDTLEFGKALTVCRAVGVDLFAKERS